MVALCMQYRVASFLRWGATSCAILDWPTCQSMPSSVVNSPRADPPVRAVNLVQAAPQDPVGQLVRAAHQARAVLQAARAL
jgi:hypothetical protein